MYISPPGAGEGPVRGSGGDEGKAPEGKRSASGVLNGELVVATRKGEDLGVDLGDFDMLDTLGASFFRLVVGGELKVLRSRNGHVWQSSSSTLAIVDVSTRPGATTLLCDEGS